MNKSYHSFFNGMQTEAPSPLLRQRIILRIKRAEQRTLFVIRCISAVAVAGSGALLAFVVRYAGHAFLVSDFYNYASLFLSDIGAILRHPQEFGLSLAESFPVFEATVALLSIGVFLACITYAAQSLRSVKMPHYITS